MNHLSDISKHSTELARGAFGYKYFNSTKTCFTETRYVAEKLTICLRVASVREAFRLWACETAPQTALRTLYVLYMHIEAWLNR